MDATATPEAEQQQTKQEEANQETEEEPVKEPIKKVSMKERLQTKVSSIDENFGTKYPNAHKKVSEFGDYFSEVWKETFPDNQKIAKTKIDQRKERAKMVKDLEEKMAEMSPEELEAYMESIPEWKRGALVVTESGEEQNEEVEGVFRRIRGKISGKV